MKTEIHPEYNMTTIKCACGHSFDIGSTRSDLRTDICSQCHPFFQGHERKSKDRGRISDFNKKYNLKKD